MKTRLRAGELTCLDGGPVHAHQSTGLDIHDDALVSTRRCVWCGREQVKSYGAGSRRSWTTVLRGKEVGGTA